MDDMQAIEQRIAGEMLRRAGPSEPVDDLAVFDAVIAANRQKGWGFTMFSALKFITAGVIVALFGGFLLAGVLTTEQGDEVAPAAVTVSPSPEAEQTTPPSELMTTDELLSGMVTEEVEPGVLRVLNDGVRDLAAFDPDEEQEHIVDFAAGPDGSVWLFGQSTFHRLGDERSHSWPFGEITDLDITPDGRLWVSSSALGDDEGRYEGVHVFDGDAPDGQRWTLQHSPDGHDIYNVEVASDGTIWAAWLDADGEVSMLDPDGEVSIGQLDDDGWHVLDGNAPDRVDDTLADSWGGYYGQLLVGDDGVVRANVMGLSGWGLGDPDGPDPLYRYDSGEWREEEPPVEGRMAVGPDGILWLWGESEYPLVGRFDGTDWRTWGRGDGVPNELRADYPRGEVAPDGSLWSASDSGLFHFDGVVWKRYMRGFVADAIEIAPDGSVWVQGRGRHAGLNTYVIRPEAAAATE